MAITAGSIDLTNAKLYMAQYDVSGDLNQVELTHSNPGNDNTRFGHTTKVASAGVFEAGLSASGFNNRGTDLVDEAVFNRIGVADVPVTVSPDGAVDTELAYFFQSMLATYNPLAGAHGELEKFKVTAKPSGNARLVRGKIYHPAIARTADGTGTIFDEGATNAPQKIFAALHVIAASAADTLSVIVQSAALFGFGSPTTRLTFTPATGKTSEWKQADGPITDEFWRVSYTIAGADPSFTFVVAFGIM